MVRTSSPARDGSRQSKPTWQVHIPTIRKKRNHWQRYLDFLKATVDKPVHACRLVSKVEQTDTKLEAMRRDPRHIFGYGLIVKLNGRDERLQLDTGASGIVIGPKVAEKAGLTRISEERYMGIGDNGVQSGYTAVAAQIRVGDLEFENCVVHVAERAYH